MADVVLAVLLLAELVVLVLLLRAARRHDKQLALLRADLAIGRVAAARTGPSRREQVADVARQVQTGRGHWPFATGANR